MFKIPYMTRDQINELPSPLSEALIEDLQLKLKLSYEARDAFAKEALTITNRELRGQALYWVSYMNDYSKRIEVEVRNLCYNYSVNLDSYVDGSYRQKMRNIFEPIVVASGVKMMTKDEVMTKILRSLDDEEPEEEIYSDEENIYQ